MVKIRHTENGNVKVTMTPMQWDILMTICNYVRLGDRNEATRAISDLLVQTEEFNQEYEYGGGPITASVSVEREYNEMDFAIELEKSVSYD